MTIPKALRETDKLLTNAAGEDARLLTDVKALLADLADKVVTD